MPLHQNLGFDRTEAARLAAIISADDFAECLADGTEDDDNMQKPLEEWREECRAVCAKLNTGRVYVANRFQAAVMRFAADRAALYADESMAAANSLRHLAYGIKRNIQRPGQQA